MSSSPPLLPDYPKKYFEYKEIDQIHGKPTIDLIVDIVNKLKCNAQCVPTSLGGGNHGYLGLVLSVTEYALIPGTSTFIKPTDPSLFLAYSTCSNIDQNRHRIFAFRGIYPDILNCDSILLLINS